MPLTKVTEDNAKGVSVLLADYWKSRGMPEYDEKWAEEYIVEGHKKEVQSDEFFVYKEENNVVGVIAIIVDVSGVAEIRDLVVKPEFRSKGYGKKLLLELESIAKEKGIRKLFSKTLPQSKKLFESASYQEEGILKSHFKDGEDLIIMSKFL